MSEKHLCVLQVGQSGACPLERNFGVAYGQNIFVTNETAPSIQSAVDAWYAQLQSYNFNSPQFTEATEDVTQVGLPSPPVNVTLHPSINASQGMGKASSSLSIIVLKARKSDFLGMFSQTKSERTC
jgi:hypothetical protein